MSRGVDVRTVNTAAFQNVTMPKLHVVCVARVTLKNYLEAFYRDKSPGGQYSKLQKPGAGD